MITENPTTGSVIITGEDIPRVRLLMLRRALKLEIETGMKMSRGVSVLKVLKNEGITTARTKDKAYVDLNALIVELGIGDSLDLR